MFSIFWPVSSFASSSVYSLESVRLTGLFLQYANILSHAEPLCAYLYSSLQLVLLSLSGIPYDYSETKGYVYGINKVEDFCGNFYGAAFNGIANIEGGAWARNGVHSEIIYGNGFMSASAGVSITRYDTPQGDWIYGKANIN